MEPQQSGGRPLQCTLSSSVEEALNQDARRAAAQLRAAKPRFKDRSLREEEVDGTCEEYESIACNNKYEIESKQSSTTTGLHARMAKLANSTGPTKALQMKKNANFKSKTQREEKPQKNLPKVNPLQLTQGSLVSSRSATCSPAMGGRKTIMSLPNRIQSGGGTACT